MKYTKYTMENLVHSYKKVGMTKHKQKPGNAYKP